MPVSGIWIPVPEVYMFGPKILEEVDSKFSSRLKVVSGGGYKYIATGALTQSGGLVREVWAPVIRLLAKNYKPKAGNCLILGLAGGTIAGILADTYPGIRITGVEIDPVMIDLGRRYLGLDTIPHLQIVIADARKYMDRRVNSRYDIILVDMYINDQLPDFVYSPNFLKLLRQSGSVVIFNHLFYDEVKRTKSAQLVEKLKTIFPSVKLVRKLTNLLIICG